MAWTTPKTWTTGEVLTSSDMNTYVRDNLSHLNQFGGALVARSTNLNVADSTNTTVTWGTTPTGTYQQGGTWWSSGNPSRLTVPAAFNERWVRVGAQISWDSNATGRRRIDLRLGGTDWIRDEGSAADGNFQFSHRVLSEPWRVFTGNYFEVQVFQTSGGVRQVQGFATVTSNSGLCSRFWIEVLR
jgi:hypothetical protein